MTKFGNKIIDDILSNIDESALLESRKNKIRSRSESWYIGNLIGEKISKSMPVLRSGQYQITISEADKLNRLSERWFNEKTEDLKSQYWNEYQMYLKGLTVKYIPETYVYHEPLVCIPSDLDKFNDGIRSALWNSDICEYKIKNREDIHIEIDEDYFCFNITFKLRDL